jgi:hypothetical protein
MHRARIGLLGMPVGELWNLDPARDRVRRKTGGGRSW